METGLTPWQKKVQYSYPIRFPCLSLNFLWKSFPDVYLQSQLPSCIFSSIKTSIIFANSLSLLQHPISDCFYFQHQSLPSNIFLISHKKKNILTFETQVKPNFFMKLSSVFQTTLITHIVTSLVIILHSYAVRIQHNMLFFPFLHFIY